LVLFGYTTDGRSWPTRRCELNIAPHLLPPGWCSVVQAAMDEWNRTGANFQFVANGASSNVVTAFDQGRWNGRLANTWIYPLGPGLPLTDVRLQINTYYRWAPAHPAPMSGTDPTGNVYCLENTVKHELGHTLFLGHSSDPNAAMFATLSPGAQPAPLGIDDINGIKAVYP
jgi:hypothetical protein